MFLVNAAYLDKDFRLVEGDIQLDGERILAVGEHLPRREEDLAVDCRGYTVTPGFVDIHIHGADGADTCDGTREAIETMARFLLRRGVTSFCPTTMTVESDQIEQALLAVKDCVDKPVEDGARVLGVNMEGPFLSAARKGAQLESAIREPDFALFQHYYACSGGTVKLVDIAPEQPGGWDFLSQAKELCTVSIAHTTADYEQAMHAFDLGIDHATHLFNAMAGMSHRAPGVVGAVFDDARVFAELICDGHHIHPAVLRTAFRLLEDRAVAVSDAMRLAGLPEGESGDLGGQTVTVRGGRAALADGTIAGSVTNLHEEVKNLVRFGIPLGQAVKAASLTPARSIGMDSEIGSIEPGKRADLLVLDQDLEIAAVYHGK